jgi:Raf kinase inhibitor-like YbhB/YbcL family protein
MHTSIRFAQKSHLDSDRFCRPARSAVIAALLTVPALGGCHQAKYEVVPGSQATLQLTSSSFRDGRIPKVYTCDGADTSPQLAWTAPPPATKSLALILIDPDAPMGAFVHWVLYNLPPTTQALPEGLPKQAQLPDGSRQGQNDFPKTGYGGPCPPGSSAHHYAFVLYAVDTKLDLPADATRKEVEGALKGHVLAHGELVARYSH